MRSTEQLSPALDHDQFLRTPALFKHGPWALLVAGVLLMFGTIWAGQWRVVEGREGEYKKALLTASAAATAATEQFNVLLGRLEQVTQHAVSLEEKLTSGAEIAPRHAEGLVLPDLDVVSAAVTADGAMIPLKQGAQLPPELSTVMKLALVNTPLETGGAYVQPLNSKQKDGATSVLVVHPVGGYKGLEQVVHVIGPNTLARIAERSLGPMDGKLKLIGSDGSVFYSVEKSAAGVHNGPMTLVDGDQVVRDVSSAMAVPLDFKSHRWLAAEGASDHGGLRAVVAQRETTVLREFKGRVDATWLIIGVATACWMLLALLIAAALFKFSRTEAFLRRLATTDLLTGLPNRRSFTHLLSTMVGKCTKSGKSLALYCVDIDNFKDVNDTLGHPVGDALLKHVAAQITKCVREADVVCRLAGDEFTVVAANISTVEEAEKLGQRILAALENNFKHEGSDIRCGASVGVALLPMHSKTEAELMQFADTALYRAKEAGRGCMRVYDASMTQQEVARTTTVRDLTHALTNDDELFLVYQPKYHLSSGGLTGHEALIRWNHPTKGLVFPGAFIPVAEQAGLIGELGNWVIRRAVRQIREWADSSLGWHKVAVNVSALQLRDDTLARTIADALGQHKVPGRFLQIELTESSLAENTEAAVSTLRQLRALGVTVAVDDFGTGFSCLGTLSQFDVDCLKVDRSFVNEIHTPGGNSICRAIINLAHSLNTIVVAEGVETEEQAQALAELGCNEVQGYLFAKPQPAELAPTLLITKAFQPKGEVPAEDDEVTAEEQRVA